MATTSLWFKIFNKLVTSFRFTPQLFQTPPDVLLLLRLLPNVPISFFLFSNCSYCLQTASSAESDHMF